MEAVHPYGRVRQDHALSLSFQPAPWPQPSIAGYELRTEDRAQLGAGARPREPAQGFLQIVWAKPSSQKDDRSVFGLALL
mgnify:CR=1 FL=1